jgi:hypothetical protein
MSLDVCDEYDWEDLEDDLEDDYELEEVLLFLDDLSDGDAQPLWHAIKTENEVLLDAMVNSPKCVTSKIINARDDLGRTALHMAIAKGNYQWCNELINLVRVTNHFWDQTKSSFFLKHQPPLGIPNHRSRF